MQSSKATWTQGSPLHAESSHDLRGAHGVVVDVGGGKLLPYLLLACLLSGAAIAVSIFAFWEMSHLERESRLMQQQLMDTEALMVREGLRRPGDLSNGPAANFKEH